MTKAMEDNGSLGNQNGEDGKTKLKEKFSKPMVKINKETLPLKITLFLFFGAMSSILPYLTIHMQAIGISITEVAIIYAVLPFTTFLGPPVLGAIADRFGNYKWILILSTVGNGLSHTGLLFVPQYREPITGEYPTVVQWNRQLNEGYFTPQNTSHCEIFTTTQLTLNNTDLFLTECQTYPFEGQFLLSNTTDENYTRQIQLNELSGNNTISSDRLKFDDTFACSVHLKSEVRTTVYINSSLQNLLFCKTTLNHNIDGIGNRSVTFWLYFLIRIIATMFTGSCFSLLDATLLAVVKKCGKAEYGKERIWSIFGAALTSPIAGVLVDRVSNVKGFVDYSPAFYLSDALLVCSIVTFFVIELEVDKPEEGILKNAAKLFRYPQVVIFLIMIFILGNLWGFVESFLFIFLKELDAPNYLLGLTLTVGSLVGIPFLWGAEKIVAKFGRVNLIIAAFLTYFVRFFGYSYLNDPFWCFPFEAMEAFTYHLMWTAAATYCAVLAPKGMLASLTGIMGSLHYSLGKGSGSFFGGLTYGVVGARLAFRYFGVAAGVFGIIFFLIDFFWISKIVHRRASEAIGLEEGKEMRPVSRKGSIIDVHPYSHRASIVEMDYNMDDEELVEDMLPKTKLNATNDT